VRLYRHMNVPWFMGTRIQETGRLRTMEFLIEQVILIGAADTEIVCGLDDALMAIRQSISDLPADDGDAI
jgi:hypothetical protein